MDIEQVREALIEWETLSANKENREIYEARAKELRDLLSNLEGKKREGLEEGRKQGRIEGMKEGMKEGRREGFTQVALRLLKNGMSVEEVAKYVELPVEEIRQLKNSIK